jgi:putative FmdB family regulatory protein
VPIYEYKCRNGHVFEAIQSMADDPITECEVCGAPVERVFHPVAVHFKGSGFYTTDYGSKKKSSSQDGGSSEGKEGKSSKSGKKEPTKAKSDGASGSDSSSSGD